MVPFVKYDLLIAYFHLIFTAVKDVLAHLLIHLGVKFWVVLFVIEDVSAQSVFHSLGTERAFRKSTFRIVKTGKVAFTHA